ncbi:nuclease-related domain-containing protein [Pseudoalteromonas carrageenovora]|uniref:nuclease-related domain-containing protein n=1 Tax=Pseudoalteromonas carrageenovora TaxID=227 RepID=UPI0026E3086A|nr:nuclease-related domain-containing protein [Pseudoalteromonas carrageenovora]MDO6546441.1 nuclease-related domain-containing protein [Pseudoalteromonas carrageenovora]MDO6830980.1 nuclease-related domain-containing protein [Pseudoalteromonas carrageenovora]
MILKDKALSTSNYAKIKAGQKQELDVAFYLRRAFKDHGQVFVFNDVKFKHNGETAQIDHLIAYTYGFILIESKSITGEVTINEHQEWSRSYRGNWQGMPSPIKQVELQLELLKSLMRDNAPNLLTKLFGKLQQGFSGREWHSICAISSNAIINRKNTPKTIEERLVKSEFITDKLIEIMKLPASKPNALHLFTTNVRPWFSEETLDRICQFILDQNISPNLQEPSYVPAEISESESVYGDTLIASEQTITAQVKPKTDLIKEIALACKQCNSSSNLQPLSGRYGYFVKCGNCTANTPMKMPCPNCSSSNTKTSKRRESYSLVCKDCEISTPIKL